MSNLADKRPDTASKEATYDANSQTWQAGSAEAGRLQIWHPCGTLILEASFKLGELHGALQLEMIGEFTEYGTNHFAFCAGLIESLSLPSSDSMTALRAEFDNGKLVKARFVSFMGKKNEVDKLTASFEEGQLRRFRWAVSSSDKVFSYKGTVIDRKAMKIPKPWPATIEVEVKKGKVTARTYFDKAGNPLAEKVKLEAVTAWGKETTAADLDGYLASGRFAHDVEAFFGKGTAKAEVNADADRAAAVFAALAEPHRAAALAFDAVVRGPFPALTRSSLSGYGFDCVKNTLYAAADKKYFGLAYTCDGDLQLLNLETGRVLEWVHDGAPFEENAEFLTLDAYAFAILRIELAAQKRIKKNEAEAVFKRLGFAWCKKLI
jgi:hypothetical protein